LRLEIHSIGKMKKGPEQDLLDRYVSRSEKAGRQLGFSGPYLRDVSESRSSSVVMRKKEEASMLISMIKPGGYMIALDEHGIDINSTDLAALLQKNLHASAPAIHFAIGGPDGHGDEILQNAHMKIRLGKMTWPHQLVRVMIAEQIYRSITLLSGHPYHRV
jgi:23S rRNA (pseudouridine1915-N3)-methyltransferase